MFLVTDKKRVFNKTRINCLPQTRCEHWGAPCWHCRWIKSTSGWKVPGGPSVSSQPKLIADTTKPTPVLEKSIASRTSPSLVHLKHRKKVCLCSFRASSSETGEGRHQFSPVWHRNVIIDLPPLDKAIFHVSAGLYTKSRSHSYSSSM